MEVDEEITALLTAVTDAREVGWDDDARDAMLEMDDMVRDLETGMESAAAIAAADGIFCLAAMLKGQDDEEGADEGTDEAELPEDVSASAHVVLASITALPEYREQFAEAEAYIELCIGCVEEGGVEDPSVQMAASALANLCAEESDVSDTIVEAGAVAGLVSLLRRWGSAPARQRKATERTVQWVAAALCNLSQAGDTAVGALVQCDAVGAINDALAHSGGGSGGSTEQFLCGCLCNIAVLDPQALVRAGGIETALAVMQESGSSRGKQAAVQIISNLQHERSFEIDQELRDAGAVESLREAARAKSPKALRSSIEAALDGLEAEGDEDDDIGDSTRGMLLKDRGRSRTPKEISRSKQGGRRTASSKKPEAAASSRREAASRQRRLPTPSRAHIWVRDAEACECDDCGLLVDTWCQRCEACKTCHLRGGPHMTRFCEGGGRVATSPQQPTPHHQQHSYSVSSRSTSPDSIASSPRFMPETPAGHSQYGHTTGSSAGAFSLERAAALLRSKNWSERSIVALLQRPEKLRAVVATLSSRPSSPQRGGGSFAYGYNERGQGQGPAGRYQSPPGTAPGRMVQQQGLGYVGSSSSSSSYYGTPPATAMGHAPSRPMTSSAYIPGRLPVRASTAAAQFGRSTNVTALPLWGVDVLNLFLPTGLAPRAVVYRCFGEAFARAEDLVDVSLLERYAVAVLTFAYPDEESAAEAHKQLQAEPRVQNTPNGWPMRLVNEGRLIKTYVKSIPGDAEVSAVQEVFAKCNGAPQYDACEVLRDARLADAAEGGDEEGEEEEEDELLEQRFEAGHLRCFYRNQTDLSEFAYACASAGFSTRALGVMERQSEWDGQTRSTPTKGRRE